MAEPNGNDDAIYTIIKALALDDVYPEKLTTDGLYEITELSIANEEHITPKTIASLFINRLTRSNYDARNLQIGSETLTVPKRTGYLQRKKEAIVSNLTQFHPLDVLVAVYLCCDPVAKQDLVKFMWGCKIAVPFIVNCETSRSPIIYKWPLRSLTTQWKSMTVEYPNIKYSMQKIGFIRTGDIDESKSALLNGVIGGPEKSHPIFFHRDMHGSQKRRSVLTEGLVELGWYFPKGDKKDRFDSCKLFANLRGDASKNQGPLDILLQVMDLVMILTDTRYLLPKIDIIRRVVSRGKKIVLILTDRHIEERQDQRIQSLLDQLGEIDEDRFEIIPLEDARMAEKLDTICEFIKKMGENKYTSLESKLMNKNVRLYVDENLDETLLRGISEGNLITQHIETLSKQLGKSGLLPFQGEIWKQWTSTEIESHKLEVFRLDSTKCDIQSYIDSLEVKKLQFRKKQFGLLKRVPTVSLYFMNCLCFLSDQQLRVFLRTMKLGLDEASRTMHRPFYERYKQLLDSKRDADEKTNMKLNAELEKLDKEKTATCIGLEHYTRELGQIYEACYCQGDSAVTINLSQGNTLSYEQLPYLATRILLSGYPIEIMDGDVGFVPETWIKEVLSSLRGYLNKNCQSRLHVISVLGIQSSGKSTLLNTMFGLQFAVSAGRCTKGVFMQMIKVSDALQTKFNCDYILAIDTEGLRAAHASTKFDNELSCFSIGLADLTIVNLMGENAKYLEENLPVVVHAFLRMDMVGLRPQCILVHQNVDKTNRDKLLEQTRLLEKVLDELTAKACEIEEIKPPKRFKDIIRFDVSDSTYYIPGLLEGHLPMGPVSIGYSQECNTLRNEILQRSVGKSRHLTLLEFSKHLDNLWNAIKTDQFVFNFKSTAETQSSLQLEVFYSEIYSSLLDTIAKLGEDACAEINGKHFSAGQQDLTDIIDKTTHAISEVGETHRKKLTDYIEDPNRLYSKIMFQWKEEKLQRFASDLEMAERDCKYQIETLFKKTLSKQGQLATQKVEFDEMSELKDMIKADISSHNFKGKTCTSTEQVAKRVWKKWSGRETSKCRETEQLDTSFIKRDAEKCLLTMFDSEKSKIEKALGKVQLGSQPKPFEIQKSHVPHNFLDALHLTDSRGEVARISKVIIKMIEGEVDRICGSKTPYTSTAVRKLLLELKTLLDRNKNNLTKEFRIDICIHVYEYVVTTLTDYYVQERLIEQNADLINQYKFVYVLTQSMIKEEINELRILWADQITDIVFKGAKNKTMDYMFSGLSSLNSFLVGSKQQCIDNLLGRTIECQDFGLIELYLTDPESAIVQMLLKCIKTDILKKDAILYFKRRIRIFETELSKFQVSIHTAFEELISKTFNNARLSFPSMHLKTLRTVAVDAFATREMILKNIRCTDTEKWVQELYCGIEKYEEAIKRCTADTFLKKKIGCVEKCPFCRELCMYDSVNHVGHHQAERHRPVGYNHIVRKDSKVVQINDCTTNAIIGTRLHREGKVIPYDDFSEFYPDWKIRTNVSNEVSLLWKWYFAKHFRDTTKKVIIPESWKEIEETRVVRSLMALSGPLRPLFKSSYKAVGEP